jgi:hypothetical protein
VGLTQPLIKWVLRALSPEVKKQRREANLSPPTRAEVMELTFLEKLAVVQLHRNFQTFHGTRRLITTVMVPMSPRQGASSGCKWRDSLQLWRIAPNILNK